MSNLNFYERLESFTHFHDFTNDNHFSPLPEDWSIVIADIKGSTQAISEGRYKDVNTIGAATIVVAKKAMAGSDFPFVFGGDGATLLIPKEKQKAVVAALCSLRAMAEVNHQLELRVGTLSMQELKESNKDIEVAKFEITSGRSVAVLRGPGISYAEKLIKERPDKYTVNLPSDGSANLEGLSCRWKPIPNKNGLILSLIVSSRTGNSVYQKLLTLLDSTLPDGIEGSNPANIEAARYETFWKSLRHEVKMSPSLFSLKFLGRSVELVVATLIFKLGLPALFFNAAEYKASMKTHSDFRKFDDVLRMTIDCSQQQVSAIQSYLLQQYEAGNLFYGTFETDSSLMTCFVEGLGQGQHIHFIDASNGGYSAAAVNLKKQMKESMQNLNSELKNG